MEKLTQWLVTAVCFVVLMYLISLPGRMRAKADKEENKSGSSDYVFKRNENARVIGGTNLDRFFIECVLSNCNDFTLEKNVAKAKLFADKYNLSYTSGIESLYESAMKAHEKIRGNIYNSKLNKQREDEQVEQSLLTRYAEYYGRDKKKAMLTDRMLALKKEAKDLDSMATMILQSSQQKESDWATWGGIASGLAGAGAGVSTAMDIQAKNAQIRAQNEANKNAVMPACVAGACSASKKRSDAGSIQKQIDELGEKLLSTASTTEVMDQLEIMNPKVEISETGAYRVMATVKVKHKLFIFDDVPATADGTIEAHVFDGNHEIGTAKMVLPESGVYDAVKIVGLGLSGAVPDKTYNVTFTGYKLWLMEK